MKRFSLFFAALMLFMTSTVFATTVPTVNEPSTTNEQITKLLQNPEFIVAHEMVANVLFTVNDDNEIIVLSVETDNDEVEAYVKNRLNYQKLDSNLELGKQYVLPVRIKSRK